MEMFGIKGEHNPDTRESIMEAYRLTGSAKIDGVI